MPPDERKRLDVRLDRDLYNKLRASAVCEGRTVNAQITQHLRYALIDWQEQFDNQLERIKERTTG